MSLKLNTAPAPHIRYPDNTRWLMVDVMLPLAFVYAMTYYHYGMRALALGAVGVLTCLLADLVCVLAAGKRPNLRDYSAVVTGMILPLMMPVSIPYYVVVTAGIFAIVAAKHPFGGVGHNVFNPAAAGFSFAAICFSAQMFTYPAANAKLPVLGELEAVAGVSPSFTLKLGGTPQLDLIDMLLGNYPGPMGATNILVLLACLLYLIIRGAVRWTMPVSFFATAALFAGLFPRADITALQSVAFEGMAGLLLFCGVFLLGDPVTTPKRSLAKAAFGILAGVMAMLYRYWGNLEEGITFALLLMNGAVWVFDMLGERVASLFRRRRFEAVRDTKAS